MLEETRLRTCIDIEGEKYAGNPGTLPHGATGIDVVDVSQRPGTGTTMRMI